MVSNMKLKGAHRRKDQIKMGPTGQACHAKGKHNMRTFRRLSLKKMQNNGEVGLLYKSYESIYGCKEGLQRGRYTLSRTLKLYTIKPHLKIQCN